MGRVLSLNCTVFVLSGWGEGSVIIVCSALDVPRTNCGTFLSLHPRELHGRREQFVIVCKGDICDSRMKNILLNKLLNVR